LVALLMFRIASEKPPLVARGEGIWPRLTWRTSAMGTIVLCLIVGSSGVYYAFFGCFLLVVAGLAAAGAQQRLIPVLSALLLAGLIGATVVLTLLPHLLYGHGNPAARLSGDAEIYALKVAQLLLPISGHRLPALAALKDNYAQAAPLINENDSASLGFVGSL